MGTDASETKVIYIENYGKDDIENISISLSGILEEYLDMSIKNISKLKANESRKIDLYFNSESRGKDIEGQISANINGKDYEYIPVFFNIVRGYVPTGGGGPDSVCYRCDSDELCDTNLDLNGCCHGLCEGKDNGEKPASNTGKIIGWVIIGVIVLFLLWFFKFKYSGTERKKVDRLRPRSRYNQN